MAVERYSILDERRHGELRFCIAQDPETGQRLYLIAEPGASLPLGPHQGLLQLRCLEESNTSRWLIGAPPETPSLGERWAAGELDEGDLQDCLLQLVETLLYLATAKPSLLPDALDPNHIYQTGPDRWVLDIFGYGLAPDARMGSGGNLIKAFGTMLRQLMGEDTRPEAGAPTGSPALRFIMMRSLWSGFGSLQELHQALKQLEDKGQRTDPFTLPMPIPKEVSSPPTPEPIPAVGRTQAAKFGLAAAVGLLIVAGALFRTLWLPADTQAQQLEPVAALAPTTAPDITPRVERPAQAPTPDHRFDGFLSAEPAYSPPRPAEPLKSTPPPAPVAKAPEPVVAAPKPTGPLDPVSVLDKKTAGDNLVTVRLWGQTLGQAYMFTNPGAPVMSIEAFARIVKPELKWEITGDQQLRLTLGRESFLTKDFIVLDKRVWLVLKPEIAGQLGLRVSRYADGFMDLEPKI